MSRTTLPNNHTIETLPPLNEVYEKVRPLSTATKTIGVDHGHGDDVPGEASQESRRVSRLPKPQMSIAAVSSSSNEFSLEITPRVTDTSNEALNTDDENGMTKPYTSLAYDPKEQDIVLSDVSLRQQQLPNDDCEYEIDLGNGWITKSISSYPPETRQQWQQQRTKSILSADSSQPISTCQIPFTSRFYQPYLLPSKPIPRFEGDEQSIVLFPSPAYAQRRARLSLKTGVSLIGVGATMSVVLIVLIFLIL